jgi:Arc/MetJ family transcription regulator
MRTNIDIDDATLEAAMRAGHFKTKKDAVEAGLKLLARQAAYREILKWEGKLHWDGDDEDSAQPRSAAMQAAVHQVNEPTPPAYNTKPRRGRR